MMLITSCLESIERGIDITFDQAMELAATARPQELFQVADTVRRKFHGDSFDLCSIINARSGRCSEDCRFCAQSGHYETDIETYDIIGSDEALVQGRDNDIHGVRRFSLVTAGRTATRQQLEEYGNIYRELRQQTDLKLCASMGLLTREKADLLRSYGVERYHCNLEASRNFFPKVCTTHTWDEKVETIRIAREAGMEICSGGIIGMGETLRDRIELAFELRELGVLSIPINMLTPIADTPFENLPSLPLSEILTCIALFRLVNPRSVIRLAGGRSRMGVEQYQCFSSGANGAIVGNYLTTAGNNLEEDLVMIRRLGFKFQSGKKRT
jgi:biotin synthase